MIAPPLIEVHNLRKLYPVRKTLFQRLASSRAEYVHAVDGVTLSIGRGEVVGLAGESGCGKSTTGRLVVRLEDPTEGTITYDGANVSHLGSGALRAYRRRAQIIFQDPYDSLNPRFTVLRTLMEPLIIHGIGMSRRDRLTRVQEMLERVELRPPRVFLHRFPHQLSGGQRQRVAIARSMIIQPEFVVADEPVSMLDVSARVGVLQLMLRLKEELGSTYLFISHDLAIVRYMCDRIAVMYLGRIAEIGPTEDIVRNPRHPYTRALLAAVPQPLAGRARIRIGSELPSPVHPPQGCRFHPRCPHAQPICTHDPPPAVPIGRGHSSFCHFATELPPYFGDSPKNHNALGLENPIQQA